MVEKHTARLTLKNERRELGVQCNSDDEDVVTDPKEVMDSSSDCCGFSSGYSDIPEDMPVGHGYKLVVGGFPNSWDEARLVAFFGDDSDKINFAGIHDGGGGRPRCSSSPSKLPISSSRSTTSLTSATLCSRCGGSVRALLQIP